MFTDNAPNQLIALAAVLALVSAGILATFTALKRHRRKRRLRAVRHARELVQRARQALKARTPEQALQVPIIVRLITNLAEREGLELFETGASQHSLQIMVSQARQTLKDARSGTLERKLPVRLALPGRPPRQDPCLAVVAAPPAEIEAGPVVTPDGLTYFYGDVEIVVVVPTEEKGRDGHEGEPFEIERFNDIRTGPAARRKPRSRPDLGREADCLPGPEEVDELFESLIIRDDK